MPKVTFMSIPSRPDNPKGLRVYEFAIGCLEGEPRLEIDRPRAAMIGKGTSTSAQNAAYRVFGQILPDLNEWKGLVEVYMKGFFDPEDLEYIKRCMESYSDREGVRVICVRRDIK